MTNEMKIKVYGALAKAENAINKASMAAIGAVTAIGATGLTAFATEGASSGGSSSSTTSVIDISSVDFSGLTNAITAMVPQILPVAVTILGIRKAISFLMSTIRGC